MFGTSQVSEEKVRVRKRSCGPVKLFLLKSRRRLLRVLVEGVGSHRGSDVDREERVGSRCGGSLKKKTQRRDEEENKLSRTSWAQENHILASQ